MEIRMKMLIDVCKDTEQKLDELEQNNLLTKKEYKKQRKAICKNSKLQMKQIDKEHPLKQAKENFLKENENE